MMLRYMSLIAVIASFLGAALMFVIGAVKTYNAYLTYVAGDVGALGVSETNVAVAYVIQSFDAFLIALANPFPLWEKSITDSSSKALL